MIVYLPLESIDMRYTAHLDRDIREYLNLMHNNNYIVLEAEKGDGKISAGSFLDAGLTIMSKSKQIHQLALLYRNNTINDNDIIFTSDLWFPGIESVAYLNYFYNKKVKLKGIIHAGSFTDTDFVRDMERWAKNFEDVIFDISDTIFVASEFIKNDILKKRLVAKDKIVVSNLPLDYKLMNEFKNNAEKKNVIIFNGRNVDEKQPWLFEELKKQLPQYEYINTHELNLNKKDYYKLLSTSKVVVSFALQENFGYGIQEAAYLGCIPILPNRLVYKEQFDIKYRYDNFLDCIKLVAAAMENQIEQSKLKEINNNLIFNKWFN
jgi:glycosyltransferase involved in cell wall biosynthesis